MRKTGNYLAQTESSLRAETLMKSQKKGQVKKKAVKLVFALESAAAAHCPSLV